MKVLTVIVEVLPAVAPGSLPTSIPLAAPLVPLGIKQNSSSSWVNCVT